MYVPFCAHAVVEVPAGVTDPFPDPFAANFDHQGQQELQPHQDAAIAAAEALLPEVPMG